MAAGSGGRTGVGGDGTGGLVVRPMRPEDVEVAEQISAEASLQADLAARRVGDRAPERRPATRSQRWIDRTRSLLETDGPGCWVADVDGRTVGMVTSLRRETLWVLATFAVLPGHQGGIGRPLLDAALLHSRGCLRGKLSSSSDPRAVRRYLAAGFDLHPQMVMTGRVDRAATPSLRGVREATPGDLDELDSLDRRARGAGRGHDHLLLARTGRALVVTDRASSGYVYVGDGGSVLTLAATDRRTAARLLWAALAEADGEVEVPHVTGANQWALRVGLDAGLTVRTEGYLGVRGMKPPAPYLHHGALL
ncbi:MAG: GNAT family N-acetyltransferase [Nocardioides sp.]